MHKTIITLTLLLCTISLQTNAETKDTASIKLLFVGDIMGHDSQINSARQADGSYDYSEVFQYVSPYFKAVDFAIANLEVTLAGPEYKGYPTFSSPDTLAIELQRSGINVVVTANNHCLDRRKQGLERTIDVLDRIQLKHTGTFKNQADRDRNNPLLLEKNGIKLALLNYTYGTNGIPVQQPNIINSLDTIQISEDIDIARLMKPDEIIVVLHWGIEYQTTPNAQQKKIASFLQSKGINIIIGSHPHVLQPMIRDTTTNQVIVYSMGNFVSNQRPAPRDGGTMIELEISKDSLHTFVSDASYTLTWVYPPVIANKKHFYVLPIKDFKNDSTFITPSYFKRMMEFNSEAHAILKFNQGFRDNDYE